MYNPAFDTFHCIYRMLNIIKHFDVGECIEVDRLRIYDYFLLFPYLTYSIRLRKSEDDFRQQRKKLVCFSKSSPYNASTNHRQLFARLRAYQMIALSQLASYGLINPELLLEQKVQVADAEKMKEIMKTMVDMPIKEQNIISWLNYCFRHTPLGGIYGLKYRTMLMEYKYG